jgi:hypothetical protein
VFEVCVCVCVSVCPEHKVKVFSNGAKSNSFHRRPSILGTYFQHVTPITCSRPHRPNSRSRSFAGLWLMFFCSQVKVSSNGPKSNSFLRRPSILGTYLHYATSITCARPHPHRPNARSRSFAGLWLKFFCSQVKVFLTAPNQTVFIADLPYLAHIFTMSPPSKFKVKVNCGLQTGKNKTCFRTLDFGFIFV